MLSWVSFSARGQNAVTDRSPIFLVGFMGAGKTTVGRVLARQLKYDFFDLDELISIEFGKTVQEIFSEHGEPEFRRLESQAIQSCGDMDHCVIALGGGAYVSEKNRDRLREIGKTVWLDCPVEVCLERLHGDTSRPLLAGEDEMRALLKRRRESYARADYVIEAGEGSPEDLAREIEALLRK